MKKLVLPILILTIIIIVILLFSLIPVVTTRTSPSNLTLFPDYFVLRNYNPDKDSSIHNIPQSWLDTLESVQSDDLVGFRCSGMLVNESGSFFIREYDTHRPVQQITDSLLVKVFDQLKETAVKPRKILRARICQTDTGTMLIEYTDGLQPYVHPNEGQQTRNFLTLLDNGTTFTPGIQILSEDIWPYPGCQAPYLLTKDKKLFYGCRITNETGYTTKYYLVDFSSRTVKSLLTCSFVYSPEPARICN